MTTNELIILCLIVCIVCFGSILFGFYQLYKQQKQREEQAANQNPFQSLSESQKDLSDFLMGMNEKQIENSTALNEKIKDVSQNLQTLIKDSSKSDTQLQNVFDTVKGMNDIMVNKKTRGNWGEYQLNNLLSIYAGESSEIYEVQYSLKNGYIGDVGLHLPDTEKVLIIDSKFPVENYQNLSNEEISDTEVEKYKNTFKRDIKKHINDISKKYINSETMESAVMFIPSEAIYFYVCSECGELIDYAHSKHVLITSPTTLLGVVFTLVNITKDMKRTKNIKALEKDIVSMYTDATRLSIRLENVEKIINKLLNTFKDVNTSSDKIIKKIEKIHDGYSQEEE